APFERELAPSLVLLQQSLDLRQREQLEHLLAAFEHVAETGGQDHRLLVQLLDDVRVREQVAARRLHRALLELGDDGRAAVRLDEGDPLIHEPLCDLSRTRDAVEVEPAHRSLPRPRERLPERSSSSSSSPPRPPRPIFSLIASMPPSTAPFVFVSASSSPPSSNRSGTLLESSLARRSSRFTASANRRYVSTLAITTRRSMVKSSMPTSETRT